MKYITSEGYKLLAAGSRVSIDKVIFGNSGVTSGSTLQGKKLYECAPHRVGTTGNGFTVEAVIGKDSGIADHEVIREIVLYSGATPFVRVVVPASEYIASETSLSFTVVIELAQASSIVLEVTNSAQYALQSHVEEAEKVVIGKIDTFTTDFEAKFEQLLKTQEAKHTELVNKLTADIAALETKVADNRRHTDNVNKKVDANRKHTDNVNRKVDANRKHTDNVNRKVDDNRRRADSQHTGSINHTNSRYNSSINHANNLNSKHYEKYHRIRNSGRW